MNGDRSVSNNIAWNGASTANWVANGDTANDGILRNINQGAMTYLGTIDLAGRNNPSLTFRPGAGLFLGDFTGAATGFTYAQTTGGYFSMLSTTANGGVAKTYSGTTTLGDNTNLVIDSENSLGTSGNITLGNSIILLQPGTTAVTLNRNFVNTAAKNPSFVTPEGSTLTLTGTMSGSTTGVFVKQGVGTVILQGDATGVLTTGSLQIRSGKLVLDAATLGSTVFPNVAIQLGRSAEFSNGGTLEITGTSAQSLGAVTVSQRANNINLTGAMTLTLGAITRTTGSTLNFSVPTGTVAYTTPGIQGLVNGATTWNGNDWASANGTNIGQYSAYTVLSGGTPSITSNATANYHISGATGTVTLAATGTLAAPIDTNTIKFSDVAARTIDVRDSGGTAGFWRLGAGGTATGGVTNAGGILVASGSGALTIGVAPGATGGSIMAGGTTTNAGLGDLVFINNSTSDIIVNSAIVNNGAAGVTSVVYDGRSTGKLILAGANTFTGAIYIDKGTLEVATVNSVASAGPLGQGTAAVGNILLNGGTFRANLSTDGATDKGFTVGGPSTIEVVANTLTINSTVRGVVTDDIYHYGGLNVGILTKTGAGTLELKDLTVNATNANLSIKVAAGTLLLNKTTTSAISAVDLAGSAALVIDSVASGSAPMVRISGSGGNQISDASSVVVKGDLAFKGVLDLNGLSETIDGLAGTGLVRSNVAGNSTLTVGGNNSSNLAPYTLAAAVAGVNATGLNSFGGVIEDGSGTVALTKTGSGTQILSGVNTYSGATTINAGTLKLGIANALPSSASASIVTIVGTNTGVAVGGAGLVLAPGTLDMGGFDQAINGIQSTTGGFVTNNPTLAYSGSAWTVAVGRQGTKTLTLGNSIAQNPSFSGIIQDGFSVQPGAVATGFVGAINLVKTGTNTQTLSGANTYGGTTAIQDGVIIAAGGTNRLPSTTAVTLGSGVTSGLLQLGDGTGAVSQTIAGLATSGTGTTNAVVGGNSLDTTHSTLVLNQTGASTYSGALGGAAANQNKLSFTLQGGGTLTVDGASNTLAGTTTVQGASTLILNSALTSSAVTVGGASAGTLISNETLGALLTVGNGGVVAPGNLLASDVDTLTLAGGLTLNTGGTLAMQIGSTATLSAPLVNDLFNITGGVFTINGGQISLTELTPALSVGALLSSGPGNYNLINYSGAANAVAFAAGSQFSNLSLASSVIGANNYFVTLVHDTVNKIIQLNVDNARFWSGATDGQWNTTVANWSPVNPTVYLNTDKVIFGDTYPITAGNANVVNATIDLTTTVTPAAVTFNNTAINYTLGGTGSIGGATGLTKSGTGALTITNANTFTGNTVISGGYVEMQHADALGTTAGSISVGNGAALRLSGGTAVGAKATSLNGDGISSTGALRNVSGNNSFAGAITLTGNTRINSDAGLLTLSGGIANSSNNLTFGGAGDITESGVIGSGAGTLTVDGTGTVTLSNAANTYTGQTFIKNGTLSVSNIGSVGVAGGLGQPAITEATIAIGDGANTGTLTWTGSSSESTDRVIDLVGTNGGAVIDASGTSGAVLTLSSPMSFTGAGAKTLTLTGSGGSTGTPNVITGAIGDPSGFATSLVKSGSGVWRLDAANTYTGTATINAGTLLFGANQTLAGVTLGGTAGASATLGLGSSFVATLSGNVTFDSTNNPLGASITGSGTAALDLGGDPAELVKSISRTFNVGSSSNSSGADLTISAVITDAGGVTSGFANGITKTGAGTLVFTAANSYVGATTVNGGVLSVNPAALGSTLTINVGTTASAELNLYADGSATPVTLATNANLDVGGGSSNGYLGFDLSGASSSDAITLAGGGVLTIGTAGGIINARALGTLSGTSYLLLDRTNIGGSIPINSANGFFLGSLPGGYSYSLDNTTTVGQLSLTVGSAAAGPYYWTGARTTDSWAELGSGGTTSNWSTNQLGTTDAGATPGNITVIFSADNAGASAINTTLDQAYSIAGLQFITNPSATGNVSIAPGVGRGTLTLGSGGIDIQTGASSTSTTISAPVILGAAQSWGVTDSGQTLTVSGVVSGNGNLLTKTGAGILVLSGVNTYDGGTTINGGSVQINSANSLGVVAGTVTINAATLQATADINESRNVSLGNAASAVLVDATKTLTFTNTASTKLSGAGVLNATGAGTLVLDDRLNANTYSGGSVLSGGGTVRVYTNTGLGSGAVTLNATTLQVSDTFSDTRNLTLGNAASTLTVDTGKVFTIANSASTKITSTGTLNATGAGTLVLDDSLNANDFSGGSVLSGGGTVKISTNTGLGSGAITINAATLNATATLSDTARSYTLGSAASTVTVNSGATYTITNGASTKITGAGRLNVNGPGILVLNDLANPNDYTGGSVLGGTGTVRISTATSLGAESGSATINNAILEAVETFSTTRNFLLGSFGSKISVDAAKAFEISGTISDGQQTGTLNKIGAGTLTLGGANGYTGGTSVAGGSLLINNNSGSGTGTGAISVIGATSVLGGTGTASGTATIGTGATLNPGGALTVGTLTLGGLTLSSGSLLSYQLGAPASSDKTAVTGSNLFTANGGTITLTGLAGLTNGTYNLITYAGPLGGSFGNLSLANNYVTGGGNTYYAALVNNTGSVDLTTTSSLIWNGNIGGTIWDSGLTANTNWKSAATNNLSFFSTMVANFDDTATGFTVNLPGTVSPSSIVVNAANDYLFQGAGAISGTTGIIKSGAGALSINLANTFNGNIALTAGSIEMKDPTALGTTGTIVITPGASLLLNNDGSGDIALGTRISSYSGGGVLRNVAGNNSATLPSGTLTSATSFISDAGKLTLAGAIASNSLAVSLIGNGGDIELTGPAASAISGGNFNFTVTMNGGTAIVANNINVGTSSVIVNGSGATTINGTITSASTSNGLSVSNSGTNIFNANVTVSGAAGGISIGGSSTNTFGASSNTTWSSTGTASISSNGNTTFNGTISGSGALTKSGAGTLTFNATSGSYSGPVGLASASGENRGIIIAAASNALGTGAVTATFAAGATRGQLQLSHATGITLGNSGFTIAGAGTDGTNDGIIRSTLGANILTGPVTIAGSGSIAGATLRADSTTSLTLNGAITASAAGRYLNLVGGGDFSFGAAGSINDSGANTVGLWSTNASTTTISSTANTYSLATAIGSGSTLVIADLSNGGSNSSIGAATTAATNLVIDNGTLRYSGSIGAQSTNRLFSIGDGGATLNASGATSADTMSFTGVGALGFNGISGIGTSSVETGARTLTLTGTNTGANTLASLIGDQAAGTGLTSIAKTGAGTWVLSGTNTYNGTTTVSAGTLLINGNQGTANGNVGVTGATLGGIGIVGGAVSINTGGILAPGAAAGTAGTISLQGNLALAGSGSPETRLSFDFTNATGNAGGEVLLVGNWWSTYSGTLLTGNASQANDLVSLTAATPTLTWATGGKVSLNQLGTPYTWILGDVLNLLDWNNMSNLNPITGDLGSVGTDFDLPMLGSGLSWDTTRFMATGAIAVTPEPSRALLLMLGLLGLFFRRRRSR